MNIFKKLLVATLGLLILVPQTYAATRVSRINDTTDTYFEDEYAETPRLKTVYVTKESFDPARGERTYFVFELTAEANVRLDIFDKNGDRIERVLDEHLNADFYVVEWDGYGYEDEEGDYDFTLQASNSKGNDYETGTIEIDEDDSSNRKPNIYKDYVNDLPYEPKINGQMPITFKSELEAEITVEIRDNNKVIRTIIEDQEMREGIHTINWDGRDDDNDIVDDGIYQYKIIARNNKGKNVEFGNFSVENADNVYPDGCAGFTDVNKSSNKCKAIKWAERQSIFTGYNDGTFRPNQSINRVEAIKAILKAMNKTIRNDDGTTLGYSDTERYAWYMPYIRTAMQLGVVQGYGDGTFRPNAPVKRVEALKIILETSDINISTHSYGQPYFDTPNTYANKWYMNYVWVAKVYKLTNNDYYFYPDADMTRADLADMLYRFDREF